MKQVEFYALKADVLSVLEVVERDGPLRYVRMGNVPRPDFEAFSHGAEIPNLGKADRDTGCTCEAFLVAATTAPVTVRSIGGADGSSRYCMDQLCNPDTVVFRPAGLWADDVVLNGQVGTASDSPASEELMKRFRLAFSRLFTKVKAYRVGPDALAFLSAGKRLTLSAQSPRNFDLRAELE